MTFLTQRTKRTRRNWTIAVAAVILIAGSYVVWARWGVSGAYPIVSAAGATPTAPVVRGDLIDTVELRGQLQAFHTSLLEAPADSGDIQIVKLAKDGEMVHKGDIVTVFDPVTVQGTLAQRRSDLKQAEMQKADAEAKKAAADEAKKAGFKAAKRE